MKDSKLDYSKSLVGKLPFNGPQEEQLQILLSTMKKYGNNHWWESKDKRVLAYWQLKEPTLIIPWEIFDSGLQNLLGRKVNNHEYAYNVAELQLEAEIKYKALIKKIN